MKYIKKEQMPVPTKNVEIKELFNKVMNFYREDYKNDPIDLDYFKFVDTQIPQDLKEDQDDFYKKIFFIAIHLAAAMEKYYKSKKIKTYIFCTDSYAVFFKLNTLSLNLNGIIYLKITKCESLFETINNFDTMYQILLNNPSYLMDYAEKNNTTFLTDYAKK